MIENLGSLYPHTAHIHKSQKYPYLACGAHLRFLIIGVLSPEESLKILKGVYAWWV